MIPCRPGRRIAPAMLIAFVLGSAPGGAQSDSRQSPPALVVDSFSRAVRDARWLDAARFVDVAMIARMRDEQLESLRRPVPKVTVEDLLRRNPDMPRVVAEYEVRRIDEHRSDLDPLLSQYARVGSADELARLTPTEVAARFVEANDMRWQIRLAMERERKRGCAIPDSVFTSLATGRPPEVRIIGSVMDDSVAYVLHRDRPAPVDSARSPRRAARRAANARGFVIPPNLTTLRSIGAEWRILPGFDSMSGAVYLSGFCRPDGVGTPPANPPSSP